MGWLCNEFILKINKTIADFNEKIENKEKSLNEIKDFFWDNMRWDYDQTISNLQKEQQNIASKITELNSKVSEVDVNISSQNITIKAAQKDAVNIEEAVENINQNISDFGVSGFKIVKYNDKYRISRDVSDSKTFHSLSEGEKMIISFFSIVIIIIIIYVKERKPPAKFKKIK